MNVAALDQRHQKLFDMVSELEQALRAGEGNAAVDRILDRPDTQVGMHFTFEESLMAPRQGRTDEPRLQISAETT